MNGNEQNFISISHPCGFASPSPGCSHQKVGTGSVCCSNWFHGINKHVRGKKHFHHYTTCSIICIQIFLCVKRVNGFYLNKQKFNCKRHNAHKYLSLCWCLGESVCVIPFLNPVFPLSVFRLCFHIV